MIDNLKRALAAIAALAALGLGAAAIAGATNDEPVSPGAAGTHSDGEAEQNDAVESGSEEADGHEDESGEEQGEQLAGPDAERAALAAERATGGTAGEVEGPELDDEAGEDENPAGTAYQVEVEKDGEMLDVYVDSGFQVIGSEAAEQD